MTGPAGPRPITRIFAPALRAGLFPADASSAKIAPYCLLPAMPMTTITVAPSEAGARRLARAPRPRRRGRPDAASQALMAFPSGGAGPIPPAGRRRAKPNISGVCHRGKDQASMTGAFMFGSRRTNESRSAAAITRPPVLRAMFSSRAMLGASERNSSAARSTLQPASRPADLGADGIGRDRGGAVAPGQAGT